MDTRAEPARGPSRQVTSQQARERIAKAAEIFSLPLLVLIWQLLALWLNDRLLPTPMAVLAELGDLAAGGPLIADFSRTLLRVLIAFCVAMVLGSAIGAALGKLRLADRLFSTWIVIGLNLPAIVVAIACYIWLGLTEFALILAVVINKTPLVATTMREGVRSLSGEFGELAAVFRMPLPRRVRLVLMPQLMPYILTSARTGLSLIWKIVLVFEVLGSDGGVGFRIGIFFNFFNIAGILAYTVAFIAVVLVVEYGLMRPLEKRMLGWRQARG